MTHTMVLTYDNQNPGMNERLRPERTFLVVNITIKIIEAPTHNS